MSSRRAVRGSCWCQICVDVKYAGEEPSGSSSSSSSRREGIIRPPRLSPLCWAAAAAAAPQQQQQQQWGAYSWAPPAPQPTWQAEQNGHLKEERAEWKGGGAGGVLGYPEKSRMYSSYSGRTRFLQGPYLGPSGLTGWQDCKLYKIKILIKVQTQTIDTTKLDTFGSLSDKWKEQKNHHCYWLNHQMEESKWNNLWGMQRSVSFFLVGADGVKSCKQLKHIWQFKKKEIDTLIQGDSRVKTVLLFHHAACIDFSWWLISRQIYLVPYVFNTWEILQVVTLTNISVNFNSIWLKLIEVDILMVIIHMIISHHGDQRWPVQQGLLVRYLKDWCDSTCRSNTNPLFLMFFCLFVSLFVWLLLKFPKISVKYGQRWFHICNPLWCLQTAVIDAAVVLVVLLLLLLLLLL